MSPILSPTFSASSGLPDLVMDEPIINDFSDLFDFDSAADVDIESHSQTTISPNHTPSPVIHATSHDPIARSPSPQPFSIGAQVAVKEEPMEYGFFGGGGGFDMNDLGIAPPPLPSNNPAIVEPALPVDMSFSAFPKDQQAALQQLMLNLFEYQKQYGPVDQSTPSSVPSQPTTIEPSLVFSSSPTNTFSSSNASASGSGSGSQTRSYVSPAPLPSIQENEVSIEEDDEPLQCIEAHEHPMPPIAGPSRSARQTSVYSSTDDLDSKMDRLIPRESIFSAGKGKGGKKGGGLSSVVKGDDEELDEDDSWRPSPEEYKKLSSKEKRQLRNKLSARAFRTRRKDYIGTLESHIKDRDDVIDEMRSELLHSRSENQDLRRELEALKASTMKIIHPESANTNSQSPAFMNALALPSMSGNNATSTPKRASSTAPTSSFNPHKDIPSSSTQASRGFWGNDNMFGGGSTICHHAFTPPPVFPRVNLNPLLNDNSVDRHAVPTASQASSKDLSQPFSEWSSDNAFNLRSMDAYRMQMWSRLTREAQAEKEQVPYDLRPKFFVESKSSTSTPSPTAQTAEATLAGAAAMHITTKLASSFWSAFSGPSSLDTDKLAAVVTGSANLTVVPTTTTTINEKAPHSSSSTSVGAEDESLLHLMSGLKLQASKEVRPKVRENPLGALSTFIKHASGVPARA